MEAYTFKREDRIKTTLRAMINQRKGVRKRTNKEGEVVEVGRVGSIKEESRRVESDAYRRERSRK